MSRLESAASVVSWIWFALAAGICLVAACVLHFSAGVSNRDIATLVVVAPGLGYLGHLAP